MELVLDLYSEEYINQNELPNTPEDELYQQKLLKIAKKYPIKKITLQPDYDNDFEYLYLFKTKHELSIDEISHITEELNEKMCQYGEKIGIKRKKYLIMEDLEY